ncbi:protein involved in gliding motility GldH [Mariniphaga anaerophila]|uniref:Protein involved in gliding motility GldH n=1 Tax=Mariniphaga anaerophila TaxID=1484053 RepID=A0A1M5CQ58_9BACT|nr:gliding motility lipoprotein GldH [Mariniphaga anaerophila]SHF56885.1 protein involved in gliding motility GldH [Mariniphaga anaerophila]
MKKIIRVAIFLFALAVILYSCDSSRVFDQYLEIPDSEWNKDSLKVFRVQITDTLANHNLLIQVRNETEYNYSNLWLFVEIAQPGNKILKDTFEIVMADPSGRWMGEGFGGLKTLQSVYRRNVYFPVSGEYTISLQQGMRDEVLSGIHDIGIRVEKVTGSGQK